MPGFFAGADIASLGASAIGGFLGLNSAQKAAKAQYKYNSKLMAQQQTYTRQNADIQYQRQRDLTHDSWQLNKSGMRDAGYNPAFVDGSQNATANVDAAAPPSNPSVNVQPYDIGNTVNQGVQNLISIQTAKASARLQNSEAALNETKQMTAFAEQVARLRQLRADASSSEAKAEIDNSLRDIRKQYEALNIKNQALLLDDERNIADIRASYAPQEWYSRVEQLRGEARNSYYTGLLSKKRYESFDKTLQNELLQGKARAALDFANASVAPTQANVNNSVARLNNANASLAEAGKDDSLAILKSQRVKAWYDAQPKDMQQVIMSSKPVREAIVHAQNGGMTSSDYGALIAAFGLEHGGEIIDGLMDFFPAGRVVKVAKKAKDIYKKAKLKATAKPHPKPAWTQWQ